MAGEVYIADKVTLDAVKNDTTNILDKNIVIDGGKLKKVITKGYSSLTTLVSVTGSGYLEECYINITLSRSVQLIITIDDVIIFGMNEANMASETTVGIIRNVLKHPSEQYKYQNLYGDTIYRIDSTYSFPHGRLNYLSSSEVFVMGEPIRFKKNLKIQAIVPDEYAKLNIRYYLG